MKGRSNTITLTQACALYIAAVLGSGVLFLPGSTAHVAGPASLIAWFLMIVLSFPLAYSFAAMSRLYPDAGGAATFVKMAMGARLGGMIGWFYFFCATAGQVIVALTGAYYVGRVLNFSETGMLGAALFILAVAGIANAVGIRVSGKLSLMLSAALLLLLLATVALSLPRVDWDNFTPFFPHGYRPVGTAVTMILWSFFGWEAICNLADRFKRPEKDIVASSVISAVVIGLVFLSLSFVTIGTGTFGDSERNLSPVGVMMHDALGIGAEMVTAALAFVICLGTVNAFVASLGQLGYALARDGVFPAWLARLYGRNQTPVPVIACVVTLASLGVIGSVLGSIPFDRLLFFPNSLGLAVYILSMAAGVKLFSRGSLPWLASLMSLALCLACLPFFGWSMAVPVTLGALYFLFDRRSAMRAAGEANAGPFASRGDAS